MKRPQKLAVMLVPTPPYEICGLERLDEAELRVLDERLGVALGR